MNNNYLHCPIDIIGVTTVVVRVTDPPPPTPPPIVNPVPQTLDCGSLKVSIDSEGPKAAP